MLIRSFLANLSQPTRRTMKTLCYLLFIATPLFSLGQANVVRQDIPNKIIRSYWMAEDGTSLIGIKGQNKGDGLVYLKTSKDEEWTATNNGEAIAPEVEDVQAVLALDDSTFFAGTWKHGLFITKNQGNTWEHVEAFPSKDVRSIQRNQNNILFAATTTHGIQTSEDMGRTWGSYSPDSLNTSFSSWKIALTEDDHNSLYALTFSSSIIRTQDHGNTWESVLAHEGIQFFDFASSHLFPNHLWAVGSNDSLGVIYSSADNGATWTLTKTSPDLYNQIIVVGDDLPTLITGSWNNGVAMHSNDESTKVQEIEFPVVSGLHASPKELICFTWGNGIFSIPNIWNK